MIGTKRTVTTLLAGLLAVVATAISESLAAQKQSQPAPARPRILALDLVRSTVLWHKLQGKHLSDQELIKANHMDFSGVNEFERRRRIKSIRSAAESIRQQTLKGAVFSMTMEFGLSEYDFDAHAFHVDLARGPATTLALNLQGEYEAKRMYDGDLELFPIFGRYEVPSETAYAKDRLNFVYVGNLDRVLPPDLFDIRMSEDEAEKLMPRFTQARKVAMTLYAEIIGSDETMLDNNPMSGKKVRRNLSLKIRKIVFALPTLDKQYRSIADGWLAQAEMFEQAMEGKKANIDKHLTAEFKAKLLKVWVPPPGKRPTAKTADSSFTTSRAASSLKSTTWELPSLKEESGAKTSAIMNGRNQLGKLTRELKDDNFFWNKEDFYPIAAQELWPLILDYLSKEGFKSDEEFILKDQDAGVILTKRKEGCSGLGCNVQIALLVSKGEVNGVPHSLVTVKGFYYRSVTAGFMQYQLIAENRETGSDGVVWHLKKRVKKLLKSRKKR